MCLAKQLIIRDLLLTSKRPPVIITCLGRSGHIFSESWLSRGMEGVGNHHENLSFMNPDGITLVKMVLS